jgi:hypothetical protein
MLVRKQNVTPLQLFFYVKPTTENPQRGMVVWRCGGPIWCPGAPPGGIVEAEQTYQLEGRAVFGGCTVLGDRVWVCVGAGKCGGRYRGEISARPKGWLEGSGDEVFEGRWPEEKEWDIG